MVFFYAKVIFAVSDAADTFMDGKTETMDAAAIIMASPLFNLSFNFFNLLTSIFIFWHKKSPAVCRVGKLLVLLCQPEKG